MMKTDNASLGVCGGYSRVLRLVVGVRWDNSLDRGELGLASLVLGLWGLRRCTFKSRKS